MRPFENLPPGWDVQLKKVLPILHHFSLQGIEESDVIFFPNSSFLNEPLKLITFEIVPEVDGAGKWAVCVAPREIIQKEIDNPGSQKGIVFTYWPLGTVNEPYRLDSTYVTAAIAYSSGLGKVWFNIVGF